MCSPWTHLYVILVYKPHNLGNAYTSQEGNSHRTANQCGAVSTSLRPSHMHVKIPYFFGSEMPETGHEIYCSLDWASLLLLCDLSRERCHLLQVLTYANILLIRSLIRAPLNLIAMGSFDTETCEDGEDPHNSIFRCREESPFALPRAHRFREFKVTRRAARLFRIPPSTTYFESRLRASRGGSRVDHVVADAPLRPIFECPCPPI